MRQTRAWVGDRQSAGQLFPKNDDRAAKARADVPLKKRQDQKGNCLPE